MRRSRPPPRLARKAAELTSTWPAASHHSFNDEHFLVRAKKPPLAPRATCVSSAQQEQYSPHPQALVRVRLAYLGTRTGNRPLCPSPNSSSKSQAHHVHRPNSPGHRPSPAVQAFESKAHPRPESGSGLELELRCPALTRPSTKSPSRRGGGTGRIERDKRSAVTLRAAPPPEAN